MATKAAKRRCEHGYREGVWCRHCEAWVSKELLADETSVVPTWEQLRECSYCHELYVNNGNAWDAHKATCLGYIDHMKEAGMSRKDNNGTKVTGGTKAEGSVVERIKQLRAEGKGFHGVAKILNDEGVPTIRGGKQWHGPVVMGICKQFNIERVVPAKAEKTTTPKGKTAPKHDEAKDETPKPKTTRTRKPKADAVEVKPDPKPVARKRAPRKTTAKA